MVSASSACNSFMKVVVKNNIRQETQARRRWKDQGKRDQYSSRVRKPGSVSPAIVEKYLADMHFPAEKKNLLDSDTGKNAPGNVVDLLNKLPNRTYKSPIDITKEIGKIE